MTNNNFIKKRKFSNNESINSPTSTNLRKKVKIINNLKDINFLIEKFKKLRIN